MFRPRVQLFAPSDDTIVCRCEEVPSRDIRAMAASDRPAGAQSGQSLHPCRHGSVPGTPMRLHRNAHPLGGGKPAGSRCGLLSRQAAAETGDARRACLTRSIGNDAVTSAPCDVIVIGGGLHGLSAALHLARAGQRVALLERSWVGRHASGASAAGVRTLGRDLTEVPIALEAMDMWHRIETIVGDDCGFHAHGQIRVAERDNDLPALHQRYETMRRLGYAHEEMVDRAELMRLVPALSPHCVGALVARRDGAADPHRTLRAFRRACAAAGVAIHEGCGVRSIDRSGADWIVHTDGSRFAARNIVNAAGAWAAHIAAMVGDEIQ